MGRDLRITKRLPDGTMVLGLSSPPSFVSGIELLAQMVLIAYLENPGQDVSAPSEGSGVRSLIGQSDAVDDSYLRVEFTNRTAKIQDEIMSRQATMDLAPEEKLARLTIMSLRVDPDNLELVAEVRIENQANQSSVLRL